jgi:protein-tyrosine phosphatase
MADAPLARQIVFQATHNFRDLGGFRTSNGREVRWRRLFRSDALHHMTASDQAYARDTLGIKTVIDLREARGMKAGDDPPLGSSLIQLRNIPVPCTPTRILAGDPSRSLADGYLLCLGCSDVQQSIVDTLTAIAETNGGPAVFHCSLGKDRTGLISAMLLGILGVSEADIVADYALSAGSVTQILDKFRSDPETAAWIDSTPPQIFQALPETMEQVLLALNKQYGSIRAYVLAHGGDVNLFRQLEEAFLAPV